MVAAFRRNAAAGRAPTVLGRDRAVSGSALDERARAIAREIAVLDLPADGIVGLEAPNGPGFLAAVVGIRLAGHPVLLLDESLGAPEIERAVRALGACAVTRVQEDWAKGDVVLHACGGRARARGAAVVKLTSGTSGAPRGVAVSAEALAADSRALCAAISIGASDRILAGLPWTHSYGFSVCVGPALLEGATLILPDGDDPSVAARRHGATFFPTVPGYLQALVKRPPAGGLPATLTRVMSAGAPLPPGVARRFRARFGIPVQVLYGASECGAICFDGTGRAAERGTVGPPLPGVRVSLRRVRGGHAVTVRSPAVANGYMPDPAPRLREGRFASDDLATWRDGSLLLLGRTGEWINVDGRKVRPREVEAVLLAMEGVQDAFVLGRPDATGGREIVHAVIACRDRGLRYVDVSEWCRRHLAPYKVPRSMEFLPEIPYTRRGKPDRTALERAP